MFLELIDHLRCPRAHAESWLVASSTRMEGRHIVEGVLGCPVCREEYPVRRGVACFTEGSPPPPNGNAPPPDGAGALRVAALLDLAEPRGFTVLHGDAARVASLVRQMTGAQLLLVNPPAGIEPGDGISALVTPADAPWPIEAASAFAAALGVDATAAEAQAAADTVRFGGRIAAPVRVPLPTGVNEIARDDHWWVAARESVGPTSGVIPLRRR